MNKVLLIDRNYMGLSLISLRKAIKLLVRGKAEALDTQKTITIRGSESSLSLSSILRLVVEIPWRAHNSRMRFSRKHVMVRDEWTCQYCEKHLNKNESTIDHIVPRSRGGKSTYNNCVACCKKCNNIKGDKAPAQVGLQLIKKPKKPGFIIMYKHLLNKNSPSEWADYIVGM